MGRRQGPKVMAYFLFMQEQRQRVSGWANRSNAELQRLCDPLWKALSKEEKAVYKEQKKALRKTERENRLQVRIPQEAKRVEFEGKRWSVKVGRAFKWFHWPTLIRGQCPWSIRSPPEGPQLHTMSLSMRPVDFCIDVAGATTAFGFTICPTPLPQIL